MTLSQLISTLRLILFVGVESLINGEQVCSVKEHHHATWDLYQAIQNKNYPRWKLYVQILDPLNSNSVCLIFVSNVSFFEILYSKMNLFFFNFRIVSCFLLA
jgi:hypothetical protein